MSEDRMPDYGHAFLDFERRWAGRRIGKERAIRRVFGLSSTVYHQLLLRLLDDPAALLHDPQTVGRLRRKREQGRIRRRRALSPFGGPGTVVAQPARSQGRLT